MIGLIGSTGLIGTVLKRDIRFDLKYSSKTINDVCNQSFDTLWIAAPSGSRLAAETDPGNDSAAVDQLIECLGTVQVNRVILISTVDTLHCHDTTYGRNRLRLEQAIQKFNQHHIFRLCTLIDENIRKNLLFDLRNRQYLDNIRGDNTRQWYPLSRLYVDTKTAIDNQRKQTNLVSPPIADREVVEYFFPEQEIQAGQTFKPYNVTDQGQYTVSKEQVFESMAQYLK